MNTLGGLSGGIRWADCKLGEPVFNTGNFARAPLSLRAGLRRAEAEHLFRFPALIPQRAGAPLKRGRAIIGRPWRDS